MIATTAERATDRLGGEAPRPKAMRRSASVRYVARWAGPPWMLLYLTRHVLAHLLAKHGFELVEQKDTIVHKPGDAITVFRKPLPRT